MAINTGNPKYTSLRFYVDIITLVFRLGSATISSGFYLGPSIYHICDIGFYWRYLYPERRELVMVRCWPSMRSSNMRLFLLPCINAWHVNLIA